MTDSKRLICKRLEEIAAQMDEVSVLMRTEWDTEGDREMLQHHIDMAGAASIARQWIEAISDGW